MLSISDLTMSRTSTALTGIAELGEVMDLGMPTLRILEDTCVHAMPEPCLHV